MNMKRNGKGNSKTPALSGLRLMPRGTSLPPSWLGVIAPGSFSGATSINHSFMNMKVYIKKPVTDGSDTWAGGNAG